MEKMEFNPESGAQRINLQNLMQRAEVSRQQAVRLFSADSNAEPVFKAHLDPFDTAYEAEAA